MSKIGHNRPHPSLYEATPIISTFEMQPTIQSNAITALISQTGNELYLDKKIILLHNILALQKSNMKA